MDPDIMDRRVRYTVIFFYGALLMGGFLSAGFLAFFALVKGPEDRLIDFVVPLVSLCLPMGAVGGYLIWYFARRKLLKAISREQT